MGSLLPTEILQVILRQFPRREKQIYDLAVLYNDTFPSPSTLVVYGLEQTHKLEVVTALLEARELRHAVVRCQESLSQRHLLSKIFAACLTALELEADAEQCDRLDSINALTVNLEKVFRTQDRKIVLVLDELDEQRGAAATLLPALARLGDLVPSISLIITTSSPRPLPLSKSGVCQIHFPPYTRLEAIALVAQQSSPSPSFEHESNVDDLQRTWQSFVLTLYDSLIAPTSTSFPAFEMLCQKLWPRFIWPALSGQAPAGKKKKWDYGLLLVKNRGLFQREGADALLDKLQPDSGAWTFDELREQGLKQVNEQLTTPSTPSKRLAASSLTQTPQPAPSGPPLLKHFPTLLLLSGYLASHTPPKQDIILFSRISSSSMTKSGKVRRRTPKKSPFKSPSKSSASGTPSKDGASSSELKMAARTKNIFDLKFGAPKSFNLERLLALLRAIHPDGVARQRGVADRVYKEMGELERLRLVVMVDDEEIEGGGKWKVNVSREWVVQIASRHGLGVSEWEIEEM